MRMRMTEEANRAFRNRDYRLALKLSEELASEGDPCAIYTCGIIYEIGSGLLGPDLGKAWSYFERLAREHSLSEGYLGCVRIVLAQQDLTRLNLAESFCNSAIQTDDTAFGYLLLGDLNVHLKQPPDLLSAGRCYSSAALRGSLWGLRRYAYVMRLRGRWLGYFTMHAIATVLTPVYLIFFGLRSTRSG